LIIRRPVNGFQVSTITFSNLQPSLNLYYMEARTSRVFGATVLAGKAFLKELSKSEKKKTGISGRITEINLNSVY
jgi:hypothetical protein